MSRFILVLRPHQSPSRAFGFNDQSELVNAWIHGDFETWHAKNYYEACELNDEGDPRAEPLDVSQLTYNDALEAIGGDLYGCDIIRNADECRDMLAKALEMHNFPSNQVLQCALEFGWLQQPPYHVSSVKGSAVCASIEEAAAWLWKDQGAYAQVNEVPIDGNGWETEEEAADAIRDALDIEAN